MYRTSVASLALLAASTFSACSVGTFDGSIDGERAPTFVDAAYAVDTGRSGMRAMAIGVQSGDACTALAGIISAQRDAVRGRGRSRDHIAGIVEAYDTAVRDQAWLVQLDAAGRTSTRLNGSLRAGDALSISLCRRDAPGDARGDLGLSCFEADLGTIDSSLDEASGTWTLTSDELFFSDDRRNDAGAAAVDLRLRRCDLADAALQSMNDALEASVQDIVDQPRQGEECAYENDGECDDFSGTNLCPNGTDLADCG
jgi:hypothetical protein